MIHVRVYFKGGRVRDEIWPADKIRVVDLHMTVQRGNITDVEVLGYQS